METFRVAGPAAAHVDMEHGLSLIGTYAEKLDYFEAQRLDLSEFIVVWGGSEGDAPRGGLQQNNI